MKIKQMVERILRDYSDTRNSDKKLIMALRWEFFRDAFKEIDGVWYIQADRIQDMPTPEAITRTRRKFQEPTEEYPDGKYPPTDPDVKEQRRKNETVMRNSRGAGVEILI